MPLQRQENSHQLRLMKFQNKSVQELSHGTECIVQTDGLLLFCESLEQHLCVPAAAPAFCWMTLDPNKSAGWIPAPLATTHCLKWSLGTVCQASAQSCAAMT